MASGIKLLFICLSFISCYHSLREWSSAEMPDTSFVSDTAPYPPKGRKPPWLQWPLVQPNPHNKGKYMHNHEYYKIDGYQDLVDYTGIVSMDMTKLFEISYYFARQHRLDESSEIRKSNVRPLKDAAQWKKEEKRYFYVDDTPTSRSVWVSPDGQSTDYDIWIKDYRSDWVYNDSMIFAYVNDTAKHIPPDFMVRKRKQRGSIQGKWDRHFLVPSRAYWQGLRRNRGRMLHETRLGG